MNVSLVEAVLLDLVAFLGLAVDLFEDLGLIERYLCPSQQRLHLIWTLPQSLLKKRQIYFILILIFLCQ